MVHYVNGNLLESNCPVICHQVNCMGKMNSGIAKAIREKWPVVFKEYKELSESWHSWAYAHYDQNPEDWVMMAMLGKVQQVQVAENQFVLNLFGQGSYGYDGKRYTSYDAFWECLHGIRALVSQEVPLAFPDHIGCCRGGANWTIIKTMIEEVLGEDYEVYIYKLEE